MNSSQVIKLLKADGWFLVHTFGSDHQFRHPTKPGKVTVPHPKKDLPRAVQETVEAHFAGGEERIPEPTHLEDLASDPDYSGGA